MSLRHPLAVIFLMVMAMSLVWSKALLAIVTILLAIIALVDIQVHPFRLKLYMPPSEIVKTIRARPFIWVFALFCLLYLMSFVYAGNVSEWWKLTHPKIAFLLMPMSFALFRAFTKKEYMLIVLCMIITAVWSTVWVLVAYFNNFEILSESLGYGGSLPTPISHIRYSVVIAVSVIICLGFSIENWKLKYRWERWAYGLTAIYLFTFLHILSVRSGLVVAYAGIILLSFFYLRKLNFWKQLALIVILLGTPIIAYKYLPGFQLKVNYTLYDLGKFKEGQGDDYSDAQRWESWRAGLMLGNQHPLFGTGTGTFRSELEAYYKHESKSFVWRPQNQWINVFAIFGLFGLVVFIFMIIYPMTYSLFWKPPMIPTLYIIQLISMMAEHPLDTQFGTSLFLVLGLLGLSYQDGMNEELVNNLVIQAIISRKP